MNNNKKFKKKFLGVSCHCCLLHKSFVLPGYSSSKEVMEHASNINPILGRQNLDIVLEELQTGRIEEETVKVIAMKMHHHVYGIFKKQDKSKGLHHVMKAMLDEV